VNAVRHEVTSAADVAALVRRGERNRACGSTALNLHSSRSHQVVTVTVQVTERDGTGTLAKLQLVRTLPPPPPPLLRSLFLESLRPASTDRPSSPPFREVGKLVAAAGRQSVSRGGG
jgi:hypothetical protein